MGDKSDTINPMMSADQLRASWQGRLLRHCFVLKGLNGAIVPRDLTGAAVLSVISNSIGIENTLFAIYAAIPGAYGTGKPMLASIARIDKRGRIVADYVSIFGIEVRRYKIFDNEREMERAFRTLADELRFTDSERIAFFSAMHQWCPCDERFDPNMDRRDPDAKRLVIH